MTQEQCILEHLRNGLPLTPIQALERYGCFRLAAVIKILRNKGHRIETVMQTNGKKHWASYEYRFDGLWNKIPQDLFQGAQNA